MIFLQGIPLFQAVAAWMADSIFPNLNNDEEISPNKSISLFLGISDKNFLYIKVPLYIIIFLFQGSSSILTWFLVAAFSTIICIKTPYQEQEVTCTKSCLLRSTNWDQKSIRLSAFSQSLGDHINSIGCGS